MRLRTTATVALTAALAATVVVVTALADLRSPEGTAELGRALADDSTVQTAVADIVVDAVLTDAVGRSAAVGPLVPFVRPLLVRAVEATVASPAGRAAVATALTDALQQATRRGPVVLDLRDAALAAAAEAPPPLDTLARLAVEQGRFGVIVLSEADVASARRPPDDPPGHIAGLPGDVAVTLAVLLLALSVLAAARGVDGRRGRLLGMGATLMVVGGASLVAVRRAPDAIVTRMAERAGTEAGPLADVLPTVMSGVAGLLSRTSAIAAIMAILGAAVVVTAIGGAGMRPAADRPPRA